MKHDVYIKENHKTSTYFDERGKVCLSNMNFLKKYKKIESDVSEMASIVELSQIYEIKLLDSNTGLHELKFDKIRVIHFLYQDIEFIFLGTFLKKTEKTPQNQIETNNHRIKDYISRRQNNGKK